MKLNNLVAQIIVAPNFDHFSAVEVRSAYLALNSDKSVDPNDARRFVYTELLKLVKKGWLKKSVSKKKEITSFIKTELFDPSAFEVNPVVDIEKHKETGYEVTNSLSEILVDKLNHYKNELLTGLGEAEEYKRLCGVGEREIVRKPLRQSLFRKSDDHFLPIGHQVIQNIKLFKRQS